LGTWATARSARHARLGGNDYMYRLSGRIRRVEFPVLLTWISYGVPHGYFLYLQPLQLSKVFISLHSLWLKHAFVTAGSGTL
jgi:hypothetical protein